MTQALLVSTFLIATCGLVYELLAGTVASYLLGDSITQFSTVIGAYLFAMGIGSYLAKFIHRGLIQKFIQVEILVGLLGGTASAVLFWAFAEIPAFRVVLYAEVLLIGILVGMEIPLLLRILKDQIQFSDLVSKVLSLDYLGALAASLLLPLWLLPQVGVVRSSFLFGIANVLVAVVACVLFRSQSGAMRLLLPQSLGVLAVLVAGFAAADRIANLAEGALYPDRVIHSRSTPYQRIVVTRDRDDVRLYLNGHLQFSSFDEYRYHEALVHPALASLERPERALVLGGGDGLAVREILRDPRVREVTLVDLDPGMTELFRDHPLLSTLNGGALRSPKVQVVNADAFQWIDREEGLFDLVVIDFPDPSNTSLGKLYSTTFYRLLRERLAPGGTAVIQATSPLFARQSFWCVAETVASVGFEATPYHVYVPSFGEWGFVVATRDRFRPGTRYPEGLRFLSPEIVPSLFEFPADMKRVPAEVNRLNNQILVQYYDREWRKLSP